MTGWVDLFRKVLGWHSSGGAEEVIDVGTPGTAAGVRLALGLYESPTGAQIADFSHAVVCDMDKGEHGYRSLTCVVPMRVEDTFRFYDQAPGKYLALGNGAEVAWEGRVEDRAITSGGLRLKALGYWRALRDVPYTAVWSTTDISQWEKSDVRTFAKNDRFEIGTSSKLHIAPKKNEEHGTQVRSYVLYRIPHSSSRQIVGIQFEYDFDMPAGWEFHLQSSTWDGVTSTGNLFSKTSSGSGVVNLAVTATDALNFLCFFNDTNADYTGETGDAYLDITSIRVVTSTTNRVNTTTTTTISSGSQAVTPASMANIYVGQRLFIDHGEAVGESVLVTAVTSTTFTATFAFGYSGTTTIHAHVVYPDEIVKDLISTVAALSGSNLSSSTVLVQGPGIDLTDESYEDAWPADIAARLAALGDASGRIWETGVLDGRRLYFRPKGDNGRNWQVDLDEPDIDSTLETLVNSVYATYQDEDGRTLRTAAADNAVSQDGYGLVRRTMLAVRSSNAAQAALHRDALLADSATITPRSRLIPHRLFGESDAPYPKWMCDPGDVITARDLPPTISTDVDRIRRFMVSEMTYRAIEDELQPVPGDPEPSLDFLVARQAEGVE